MPADTDQVKRIELLDKISALLAKTLVNGCTEAEALAAAELAQRLMAKYGLSLAELETVKPVEACSADGTPIGNQRCHEVVHCANAIAYYTDTKSWYQRRGIIHMGQGRCRMHEHRGIIAVFFGLPADVEVAIYLTNTLQVAMDSEWSAFWKTHGKTSETSARTARANFMRGMAWRLSARLHEMKQAQGAANTNNCRAIVLAKERIVTEAYAATGIKPRTSGGSIFAGDAGAYFAGDAAGTCVTIARGAIAND
jgi:hypothetical protein